MGFFLMFYISIIAKMCNNLASLGESNISLNRRGTFQLAEKLIVFTHIKIYLILNSLTKTALKKVLVKIIPAISLNGIRNIHL